MENPTEFSLNHAIQNWRQHLSQSPSYRTENLEELEAHLRDSMATLAAQGLTEEEAFLVAARRMGGSQRLEPEFAKVNGQGIWLNRLLWMLIGVQAWWLIGSIAGALGRIGGQLLVMHLPASTLDLGAMGRSLYGTAVPAVPTAVFVFTQIATLVALLAVAVGCGWLIQRNRGGFALLRSRGGLALAGIAFCLTILLTGAISPMSSAWIARSVGAQEYGKIAMSMTVANMVLFVLQAAGLAALTVLLALRQRRRAVA